MDIKRELRITLRVLLAFGGETGFLGRLRCLFLRQPWEEQVKMPRNEIHGFVAWERALLIIQYPCFISGNITLEVFDSFCCLYCFPRFPWAG